jgi:hypothetical protein
MEDFSSPAARFPHPPNPPLLCGVNHLFQFYTPFLPASNNVLI